MCDMYTWQTPSLSISGKPILPSERMLHKDNDRKGSVAKNTSGHEPQGAWRQVELIGGEPPAAK
jgi:hypothetical protein